jgi:hypothetical protein
LSIGAATFLPNFKVSGFGQKRGKAAVVVALRPLRMTWNFPRGQALLRVPESRSMFPGNPGAHHDLFRVFPD